MLSWQELQSLCVMRWPQRINILRDRISTHDNHKFNADASENSGILTVHHKSDDNQRNEKCLRLRVASGLCLIQVMRATAGLTGRIARVNT